MTIERSKAARLVAAGLVASILGSRSVNVGVGAQASSARVAEPDVRGLHLTAEVSFGALPAKSMYWHIYEFASRAAAEAARPARGTVGEAFGRHWLYVIAEEEWRTDAGRKVSVVGPFILSPDASYTARYMRAFYPPVETNGPYGSGHRHPGPEAWYVVSGGQCLETPNGLILANAGQAAMVPEGWPMAISSVGSDTRRALVLILHRSDQPYSMALDDHRSHGAPHAQWTPQATCPK